MYDVNSITLFYFISYYIYPNPITIYKLYIISIAHIIIIKLINYNIGSLKEELDNINTEKPIAACDLSSPEFMSITLVEWSLLYAFISLLFMIYILHKNYGNKNEL